MGSLGFLSTGDKHAQGNYGLKDIVMALKWVKENIASFGGDSEKVTIFGLSSGSGCVHYLLQSNMADGLFHQAIMMSGTANFPWAFQTNPRRLAVDLGRKLGLEFNSTEVLVQQLRKVDHRKMLKAERGFYEMDKPLASRPFDFAPNLEPEDSKEERFVTKSPNDFVAKETALKVPLLIGITSNEGLIMITEYQRDSNVLERFNENDDYLWPFSFGEPKNLSEVKNLARFFRKLYFGGRPLSSESLNLWAEFQTDLIFKFPTDRVIRSFLQHSSQPIYKFIFSYEGGLNFPKNFFFLNKYRGACHADTVFYVFEPAFPIFFWHSHTLIVRQRVVRMWTNFAKTG